MKKIKLKKTSYDAAKDCKDLNEWVKDEEKEKNRKTKKV